MNNLVQAKQRSARRSPPLRVSDPRINHGWSARTKHSLSSSSSALAMWSVERLRVNSRSSTECLTANPVYTVDGFSDLVTPSLGFDHIWTIEQLAQTVPDLPQSTPNLQSLLLSGRSDLVQTNVPFGPFIPLLLQ